jgi:hypothetical protein
MISEKNCGKDEEQRTPTRPVSRAGSAELSDRDLDLVAAGGGTPFGGLVGKSGGGMGGRGGRMGRRR